MSCMQMQRQEAYDRELGALNTFAPRPRWTGSGRAATRTSVIFFVVSMYDVKVQDGSNAPRMLQSICKIRDYVYIISENTRDYT